MCYLYMDDLEILISEINYVINNWHIKEILVIIRTQGKDENRKLSCPRNCEYRNISTN